MLVHVSEFAASVYKLMYIQQVSALSRCSMSRHILSPSGCKVQLLLMDIFYSGYFVTSDKNCSLDQIFIVYNTFIALGKVWTLPCNNLHQADTHLPLPQDCQPMLLDITTRLYVS